jgi:sugar lactone lactonase YvrE
MRSSERAFRRASTVSGCAAIAAAALLAGLACNGSSADASRVEFEFAHRGLGGGEFSYPRNLAVSPVDGAVFVVDKTARIQRFSADGEFETGWKTPAKEFGKPTGLCVDRRNLVLVADTHYSRVMVYDRDGNEVTRFGAGGEGPGQFIWPTNIAVDSKGCVFVGEYGGNDRISRFTPDYAYEFSFAHGDARDGGTNRPQGLAFDARDTLWVADASHHRICRYSRDGKFLGAFGAMGEGEGEFRFPYDVAVFGDGTLAISDYGNNRVARIDQQGKWLGTWGKIGRRPGEIRHAWSLDVGGNGLLYVLDSWNNRVQVVNW